jgi:NAD-dependent dihydropyrimidine dehydrogenase PreA subunit
MGGKTMALRKVVKIDEEKCTGCGECVPACAEGAIQIVDGIAKLAADNLCDGLGACLGDCPEDAITIEEREADEFDEVAVEKHTLKLQESAQNPSPLKIAAHPHVHGDGPGCGCPGSKMIQFDKPAASGQEPVSGSLQSELRQWPVQLHLVPPTAPYFKKADVLLAADCVAFAMGNFHSDYLKEHALAIACPKLDQGQDVYLQKLVAMIDEAKINTLTVMVMEVPCCTGLVHLAKEASALANRKVPVKKMVIGLKGDVLNEEWM